MKFLKNIPVMFKDIKFHEKANVLWIPIENYDFVSQLLHVTKILRNETKLKYDILSIFFEQIFHKLIKVLLLKSK